MSVMQVIGNKQLGADLSQWHYGMDAIYAVGSQFYAGRPVDVSDAEDALRLLEQEHRNRKATKLSRSAVAHLNKVIRNLRHRIDAASARPNPIAKTRKRPADAASIKRKIYVHRSRLSDKIDYLQEQVAQLDSASREMDTNVLVKLGVITRADAKVLKGDA